MMMNQQKDRLAGWLAVVAGVALIPEVLLLLGFDTGQMNGLGILAAGAMILALRIGFTAYALLRFRASLRRTIDFRGLDALVPAMIVASVALGIAVIAARLPAIPGASPVTWISLLLTGGAAGGLSVAIGWRLLQVDADLGGLGKPFAWTCILAPVCFATVVAAPLGLLFLAASSILLGLILLRGGARPPEFV
jgi:hypothetical protein